MTHTQPSIAQMKNRMNSGHRAALAATAKGESVYKPTLKAWEIKGWKTVLATLEGWHAIVRHADRFEITEIGKALL